MDTSRLHDTLTEFGGANGEMHGDHLDARSAEAAARATTQKKIDALEQQVRNLTKEMRNSRSREGASSHPGFLNNF